MYLLFKDYTKEDLSIAIFVVILLGITLVLLRPFNDTESISGQVVKAPSSGVIGFSVIIVAIIVLIIGFLIGFKNRKNEIKQKFEKKVVEEKKIVTEPLPHFEEVHEHAIDHELDESVHTEVTEVPKIELPPIETKVVSAQVIDVPKEKQFYLHNGEVIKNLEELKQKIKSMPDDIFYYHVAADHNHFADWVIGVFNEEGLSQKLRLAKNKQEFETALNN